MPRPDPELTAFYDRYAHVILRRTRALLTDPKHADAALLATFEEAAGAWDRVQNASPLVWLYRESTGQARRIGGDDVHYWDEAGGDELTWRCLVHAREDRMGPAEIADLVAITADDARSRAGDAPGALSRLVLERFATGELRGEARSEAQRALMADPDAMRHLEVLKQLRKEVPEPAVLVAAKRVISIETPASAAERKITETQDDRPATSPESATAQPVAPREMTPADFDATPRPVPSPAIRRDPGPRAPLQPAVAPSSRMALWAAPVAVVALFLLVVGFQLLRHSSHHLDLSVGGAPYRGEVLEPGATVTFAADAPAVLVAVEPDGRIDVRHPPSGTEPAPLSGPYPIGEGNGPEMFVAVFGRTAEQAKAAVEQAYASGQAAGVHRWVEADGNAVAVVVQRR